MARISSVHRIRVDDGLLVLASISVFTSSALMALIGF